ncbi:MAG: doxx family protein [Reichenbachiella sp.]|uniref:doxx family protein n=1 Tax=Reichenbachiella sp. TaxID=2184521 RepID=UPI0029661BE7|nr:doxx family protein [Reichenbachiella sp.]MDW3212244.1 doxx family protein [Reichenbachiella sp.]
MSVKELSEKIDDRLFALADRHGMKLLEASIGIIYLWFGGLKFFPNYSPAEVLAGDTLDLITFHLFDKQFLLRVLAFGEILIGLALILRIKSKYVIWGLLVHMGGTFSPIIFFPEQVFTHPPFGFSMVGQYIMKNLVIISATLVIYTKNSRD